MPFSSPARARSSLSRGDLTFVVCVCVCADRFCGRIVSWGKAFHEVKYGLHATQYGNSFDDLVIKNSEFLMSESMSTGDYFDSPARCVPVSRIAFQGLLLESHSILADTWSMGRQWLPRMWLRAHPVCTAGLPTTTAGLPTLPTTRIRIGHANRLGMTNTYAAVERHHHHQRRGDVPVMILLLQITVNTKRAMKPATAWVATRG